MTEDMGEMPDRYLLQPESGLHGQMPWAHDCVTHRGGHSRGGHSKTA